MLQRGGSTPTIEIVVHVSPGSTRYCVPPLLTEEDADADADETADEIGDADANTA